MNTQLPRILHLLAVITLTFLLPARVLGAAFDFIAHRLAIPRLLDQLKSPDKRENQTKSSLNPPIRPNILFPESNRTN